MYAERVPDPETASLGEETGFAGTDPALRGSKNSFEAEMPLNEALAAARAASIVSAAADEAKINKAQNKRIIFFIISQFLSRIPHPSRVRRRGRFAGLLVATSLLT